MAANATPDNAEQLRRRANRRLLGASVLLLIAIIAVPMFLEREPPPLPDNVDVRIPPVEGSKFEPKFPEGKKAANEKPADIPAITEPTGAQASVSAVQPVTTPPVIAPLPVASEAPVAAKSEPPAAAKAVEKLPEKSSSPVVGAASAVERKPGQLVIQLIAVRDPATAKQLYEAATALKFPAYTEKIDVTNGVVIRVRVGPYVTKQQAESARVKLVQAGFEAKVLTLQ